MSSITSDETVWAVNPFRWSEAEKLSETLGLPLVAAMVLAGRGLNDPAQAKTFLECAYPLPDPFLFAHMDGAVEVISRAIEQGKRIVVHGDYDADGITATCVVLLALRELGVRAEWYLPSRFKEGYGLSRTAVETIAEGGPAVLVTVDCGVNYPEEVAMARAMGLEVVVIDHHRPGPRLPDCLLIHEVAGDYPHGDLCGVGLALKVMHALYIRLAGARREAIPEQLYDLLDLVAIGTIADLAPLRGENRYYVQEGLRLLGIGRRTGLRALAAVAGCAGAVDSGTVAYRLAPRLNAAGRLADPSPPLRLLLTEDEREAAALAAQLQELNGARQDVERQILDEALERVESLDELPAAIVLAHPEWHEGVVGIVASRLVERYHRPAILLGIREGVAKGSGRSIAAYDLMAGLNASAHLLTVYGGHMQAVGLTLDAERVPDFRMAIEEHAGLLLSARDLVPVYRADAVMTGVDMNADVARALASFGPFGTGNPRPRLLLVGASMHEAEATRNGAHLRCAVEVDHIRGRGIGFGMGGMVAELRETPGPRCAGVQFQVDEWQGVLRPEFQLERIGPVCESASVERRCAGCRHLDQPVVAKLPDTCHRDADGDRSVEAGEPAIRLPLSRDGRDRPSPATATARILSTGERTLLVTCSASQALRMLGSRLPVEHLAPGLQCAGPSCLLSGEERLDEARVALLEWEATGAAPWAAAGRAHLVVLDPPFRPAHTAFIAHAAGEGSAIHLVYGDEERRATARLLRYMVHPRFAMVCLYRAMQAGEARNHALWARARDIGWREGQVLLTPAQLHRAERMLDQLGVERGSGGEAKIDARSIPAYLEAETEYEECSRLCLSL